MSRLGLLSLMLVMVGCQSHQYAQLDTLITKHSLERSTIIGNEFQLLSLSNRAAGDTLRVYIEGDGLPWKNRTSISSDPTPRITLALSLMTQDKNKAIYLGRPCYFSQSHKKECSPKLWTSHRYSEQVISSMKSAIEKIIIKNKTKNVVLIGYSGGGVLASLLAERMQAVQFYVTIAANLDIELWTKHHKYSPLFGSINPARELINSTKNALHFIGSLDHNVPPITAKVFSSKTAGKVVELKRYDHSCCWVENWPKHLKTINAFSQTIKDN